MLPRSLAEISLEVRMLSLIRPLLVAALLVLAGLWVLATMRSLFSSVGFYLFLALVAIVLVRRARRGLT